MKKKLLLMLILVLSVAVTACTYWTPTEKNGAFFDTEMKESVKFEQSMSGFDRVEINVDLTVSTVNVNATEGDTLKYEQKANKEELLAKMDQSKRGDTMVLTFKNEVNPNLLTGTQNSEANIWVPSNIEVVWVSDIDVGDLNFDMNHLDMIEIDAQTNVGKLNISAKEDFDKLTYVKLRTNVGEVELEVNGALDVLEKIDLSTNTGSVMMALDGELKHSLEVEAKSDVGSVDLSFSGEYENPVICVAKASVGDVTIDFPRKHEVILEVKTSEFTSKLDIEDLPFVKSQNTYRIKDDGAPFELDVTVSIGDATLGYSK